METGLLGEQPRPAGYWRKVLGAREWKFPRDHFCHQEYAVEWHYLSGIFSVAQEIHGYHLCLFRLKDELFTHFSISTAKNWFGCESRVPAQFEFGDGSEISVSADISQDIQVRLLLRSESVPFLHGANGSGLSRKSFRPNHASHYYSVPGLKTEGTIQAFGKEISVKDGMSWFDHEFADSIKQPGFSWAFIQCETGPDSFFTAYLMFDEGELVGEFSRAIMKAGSTVNDLSDLISIAKIPSLQNPNFAFDVGIASVEVAILNEKAPIMRTSIGDYLELPCTVKIGDETHIGMLEIPKP